MRKILTLPLALAALSGCSSIINGSTQELMINTNPSGADCAVQRQGLTIGRVAPTPGAVTVKKTKYDIQLICTKPGYQTAQYYNRSGSEGATWGNIILGGGIGWAIDSASGSDNHYESPVNMTMVPLQPGEVVVVPQMTPMPLQPQVKQPAQSQTPQLMTGPGDKKKRL